MALAAPSAKTVVEYRLKTNFESEREKGLLLMSYIDSGAMRMLSGTSNHARKY